MKMKLWKRMLATLLATLMCSTALTACQKAGTGVGSKGKTEIKVNYWLSGMGEDWLKNMIAAFEEEYPEYNVKYTASSAESALLSAFGMEDIDEVDLYLVLKTDATEYLEPLDDLLETTAPGDEKTLGEKFNSNYLAYEKSADGHYYTLTYGGGMTSFYYNKELFEKAGITQLPRTTDELAVLCDTLYSKKITPLCHFKDGGYYDFLLNYYMAQYDGMDYYLNNYWACTDEEGNSPSKDVLTAKDGRYYAIKAMEKFITPSYTMAGSTTQTHTEVQTQFMNASAAMMLNGSWIENEMKTTADSGKLGVMRTPVLSAIVNKLTTVKTDAELRKLITAIDQVADGEKQLSEFASGDGYVVEGMTVSADDWNYVANARKMISCNYASESAYIPNYSKEKEGAKKFLAFMYSDAGYKIYMESANCPLPLEMSNGEGFDVSDFSEAQQTQFDWIQSDSVFVDRGYSQKSEIFKTGGASEMVGVNYVDKFCAANAKDRMSADNVWKLLIQKTEDNYDNWLLNMNER